MGINIYKKNNLKMFSYIILMSIVTFPLKSQDNQLNPMDLLTDPILMDSPNKYVMFPIHYNDIWLMYKKEVDCFWKAEEVDLTQDIVDWNTKLSDDEKNFLSMTLAFFAASDGIVLENLAQRFMSDVKISEARAFYGFQIAMENIHSEMYSILIQTLITDELKKTELFNAIDNFPCIAKKSNWAIKWIDNASNFEERLIAFACVEGIFFSSSFASIYWIKKRGLMPGLTFSNELISRDESLHTEFAVLLYSKLQKKISSERFYEIIMEAINIEKDFVVNSLPSRMIGMNSKLMLEYIEFVSDRLCVQLGYSKIFNSQNPFDFVELISVDSKVNFFERTNSSYALANKQKNDSIFDF